ncbi:hypothetical protein laban61_gp011 [Flavobacterium phage vB_FspS_laban6-1]|uniref:Uncharacterized protein n=1 Tax=Flavobacterium phage vB_FspS_laban6-1 TaxID=2686250 RepID=A0A6B9LAC8_9CAUD|nr:hypothetical protein HWC90_gp11 [Flavobacterium phage vB_FspS_laban6-1]QHB38982.1 hypothetical protein laban61_gp011 [Flavobacterium phage vB_FspS_laban6-1]
MNYHIRKLNDPDYWKFLLIVIIIVIIISQFV